jgi:hypothetical protein
MNTPTPQPNDSPQDRVKAAVDKVRTVPLSQATPLRDKLKAKGTPVPTTFKHIVKIEWCRSFPTWSERLKVLFGGNLVVMIGVATQHNPGTFQPLILGKVTNDKSPTDYMKRVVEGMIEERHQQSSIEHEPEGPKK